jgi:hypothetical protein
VTDEFPRLLQGKLDARVRDVLGSALADAPSHEGFRVAARALGLPTAAADLARASAPAAGAAQGKLAAPWVVFKWFATSVAIGGVTGSALWFYGPAMSPDRRAQSPTVSEAAVAQGVPQAARDRAAAAPSTRVRLATTQASEASGTPLAVTTREARRTPAAAEGLGRESTPAGMDALAKRTAAETPETKRAGNVHTTSLRASGRVTPDPADNARAPDAPEPADALAEEIALLDGARRALSSGDPVSALAALDRYDAARSKHVLKSEALLLRVRALLQSERKSEACSLARRHIDEHATDAYAQKLGRLCRQP